MVEERSLEESRRVNSLDRLIGLSDGIFAFAITLLALDLVTPVIVGQATDTSLAISLVGEFHSFFGFFVSFWVISLHWLSHHRIFRYIKTSDPGLLALNLALLFFVVLIPFATRVLNYGFLPVALIVYALIQIGALVMDSIIWKYASRDGSHLLDAQISSNTKRWLSMRGYVGSVIFALSILIAFVNPDLSVVSWLMAAPILVILDRRYSKRTR